jgi:Fic family protein
MNSLTPTYLHALTFSAEQASVMRTLGECRGKQQLYERQRPELLEALLTVAKIESTDASNKLEGITAPEARLEALVRQHDAPRNRSEQEIAGYRDALELIHQSRTDMPVTVNVIRQLHQRIYSYLSEQGGDWKLTDNEIVERAPDGNIVKIRFKPVSAVATPQAMQNLIQRYESATTENREPLLVIPLLILDFLCIHPFRDGNGRIARLLTLLVLYHAGYDVGRFIGLERVIQDSYKSYYETLEASSQGWHESEHDVMPWLEYFWGVLLRAYKEFEERVGNLNQPGILKSQRVREAVERKVRPFRIVDIERECPDVSRETIRLVLRAMKKEGLIEPRGRGRGVRWRKLN